MTSENQFHCSRLYIHKQRWLSFWWSLTVTISSHDFFFSFLWRHYSGRVAVWFGSSSFATTCRHCRRTSHLFVRERCWSVCVCVFVCLSVCLARNVYWERQRLRVGTGERHFFFKCLSVCQVNDNVKIYCLTIIMVYFHSKADQEKAVWFFFLWDFVRLEPSGTWSLRRRESNAFKSDKISKKDFSGWPPTIAFLYLFLFHSLLRLTSFLSQYKDDFL